MGELQSLFKKTEILKNQIFHNHTSLLEEELRDIFESLKSLLSPEDLEVGIKIMNNGTIILQEKVIEIHHYITDLIQKDQIMEYFNNNPTERELYNLILLSWQSPQTFLPFSQSFLDQSVEKLITNKKFRQKFQENPVPALPDNKEITIIDALQEPFIELMKQFCKDILPRCPATIEVLLLQSEKNREDYFAHFSIILHLLQAGYLTYNPKTKLFSPGDENFE